MQNEENKPNLDTKTGDNSQSPATKARGPKVDIKKTLLYSVLLVVIVLVLSIGIVYGVDHYRHDHQEKTVSTNLIAPIQASITPTGFSPNTISINVGRDVVWTNYDTKDHTVSSDPYPADNKLPGFKSQILAQNQTYSFIFDKKGTFTYHDDMNPNTFKGSVVVK